jgi:hypothetical protein
VTIEVRKEDWTRTLPAPDTLSGEYWSALASGRLLFQECPSCGHRQFYPRAMCTQCAAAPEWREASGLGIVHTFTVIRQNGLPGFKDEVPYVVAMIELAEGPRLMGYVTGCPIEDVAVGMSVKAYAVEAEPGLAILQWEPGAG